VEVNGAQRLLVTDVLQNIYVCVQQKKETHSGLKHLEGEYMMTEFDFEVNYPFNKNIASIQ